MFLTLLSLPSALAAPDLAELAAKGELRAIDTAFVEIEREVAGIAREGGDAEAWWADALRQAGLDRMSLPVLGAGALQGCVAHPEVFCSDGTNCYGVAPGISCTLTEPSPAAKALTCGDTSLPIRAGGVVLDVDRCLRTGELPFQVSDTLAPKPSVSPTLSGTFGERSDMSALFAPGPSSTGLGEFGADAAYAHSGMAGGVVTPSDIAPGAGGGSLGLGGVRDTLPPALWRTVVPVLTATVPGVDAAGPAKDGLFLVIGPTWRWISQDGQTLGEGTLSGSTKDRKLSDLCASPDGRYQGVVFGSYWHDTHGGSFEVWDLGVDPPNSVLSVDLGASALTCAFSADGASFAAGTRDAVRVYPTDGWVLSHSRGAEDDGHDPSSLVAASPRGNTLMIEEGGQLLTWDLRKDTTAPYVFIDAIVPDAAWTAHGLARIADPQVLGHDADGDPTFSVPVTTYRVAGAGDVLLVSRDGWPLVLDAKSGEVLGGLRTEGGIPLWLALTPDGRLAVETLSGEVRAYRIGGKPREKP